MPCIPVPPALPIEIHLSSVVTEVLGEADPRTLSPGDYRALHAALARRGMLHCPELPGALRARGFQPDGVLRSRSVQSVRWRPVARPPVWTPG